MAKKYTRAQWARLQAAFPEEDRTPYEDSPDAEVQTGIDPNLFPRTSVAVLNAKQASADASAAIAEAELLKARIAEAKAKAAEAAAKKAEEGTKKVTVTGPTGPVGPTTATSVATTVTATTATTVATTATGSSGGGRKTAVGTYIDPETGDVYILYSDGTRELTAKGTKQAEAAAAAAAKRAAEEAAAKAAAEAKRQQGQSAYSLLYEQFSRYGLGSLVEPLKGFIIDGLSPAEFTLKLRDTDAYRKRFAANQVRIQKGLRALSEAEYINLEDQYQDVMRRYGMPESYYTRGEMGIQSGFEKFIGLDVSPVELEDRVQTAYNRVINANPEVGIALRTFYPDITNGDILAYALDPNEALDKIKRKITAAEIGGTAVQMGLTTNLSDAEYLARYGITKEQAQQGYRTISGYLPRAQQLSSIYGKQVEGGPYTQASAEQEVFGVPGAAEAERKRKQITSLEQAAFSGSSGLTGGALGRERAGSF